MSRVKRNVAFSLAFLDIMACGFGAVIVLFMILRGTTVDVITVDPRLLSEIDMLQTDIRDSEMEKIQLLNSLEKIKLELVEAQGLSKRVITDLEEQEKSIQNDPNDLDKLRRQVEQLEDETAQMEEVEFGDKVREFQGDGNRQYLTGLKLGGERVLILVDGSASMLADTVVNAAAPTQYGLTSRKNSRPNGSGHCAHWNGCWPSCLPAAAFSCIFLILIFRPQFQALEGEWLDAADDLALESAVDRYSETTQPGAGTSSDQCLWRHCRL